MRCRGRPASPRPALQAAAPGRGITQDVLLVHEVHLLQEDEGEDRVRPQTHVVRREALPQGEETLVADHLHQDVGRAFVLWFSVYYFHVLDSRRENQMYAEEGET